MIDLKNIKGIHLYSGPTDLRKSSDGLLVIIQNNFDIKEIRNHLFLFSNKRKNRIKIIEVDYDGIWIYQKSLINSKYAWPKEINGIMELSEEFLNYLLKGLDITKIHQSVELLYTY